MKICDYCKKEYERHAKVISAFGARFCLHDDKLDDWNRKQSRPVRNDSLKVNVVKEGKNKKEQAYIDEARMSGDHVVRGSDELLRRVGSD